MGQEPYPKVDPLSGAVEYPSIEYRPTPPPGYSMPPMPPPLPSGYGPPPGALPPPTSFPPPNGYPPPGGFPPPPPSGYPPPAGYGPPPSPYAYGAPYVDPTATNGKAIGALVTSIAGIPLCFCVVPSIVGIILGLVAMSETKKTGQNGHGMALAGVIVGAVSLVLMLVFWFTGVITNTSNHH
jgi:hypothetical protein